MDNISKIHENIRKKGRVTSKELMAILGATRQYVHQSLQSLISSGDVVKIGKTRGAFYVSKEYLKNNPEVLPGSFKKRYVNKKLEEHTVFAEIEEQFPRLRTLPENIHSIFTFAFSEMFNNAIEHSQSSLIAVEVAVRNGMLSFLIEDSGVGAFRNIKKKRNLESETEAIRELLKGKITTMPTSHSGEGIFFTSRVADSYLLDSFGLQLIVVEGDPAIKQVNAIKRGTRVVFEISMASEKHLNDIFKKYTNLSGDSDYGFDKTEIRVRLYATGGIHVSRSQARRILEGLEKFDVILLDFEQVPMVGQAFADEVYRVFQNKYPSIEIKEENMSEGVRFMIGRAKNEAKKS